VLRAATFFGVSFHAQSVAALLGGDPPEEEVQRWLEVLITREVLEPAASDGPRAYRFRHDLYRESADASLTDADRTTGHRLAGRWLAEHRAADPSVIAEHLQRGDRTAEAARWFVRAADQALRADDFESAVAFGERAVTSGAEDELLGEVRAIQAEAHQWRGDDENMEAAAIEALERLSPEHPRYGPAAGLGALSAFRRGRPERTVAIAEELLGYLRQRKEVSYPLALAGIYCAEHVHLTGRHELGAILLALVETKAADKVQHDPLLAAARAKARARAAAHSADAASSAGYYAQAAEAYDVIGDRRLAATMRGAHGCMMSELGAFEKATSGLEKALEETRRLGLTSITAAFEHNLAIAYARSGRLDEADAQQRSALTYYRAQGFERMVAGCHIWLALTALERGALDEAEGFAAEAVAQEKAGEPVRAYSLAVRAKVALAAERNDEARELADKASVILSRIGHLDEGESLARLVHAQALLASGDETGARKAITAAQSELLARADRITEPELRQSFLERVAENAATLELVERLGRAS
jgi:tetratricopeptide (TPR) repeat protein